MKISALECIDFYKAGHILQFPENTEFIYANFTPRSSRLYSGRSNTVVFFGLQGFIKWFLQDLWDETFFKREKSEVLEEYKRLMDNSLGKDSIPMDHIAELHDLGFLPLKIKALPEGSKVGMKVPVLTVVNTYKKFHWLVGHLETVMSSELWKSCTNATIANEYKSIFTKYAIKTGAPLDFVPFQGHDFSFRGMSGIYDAAQSGAAHLTSFVGTDVVPSLRYLESYYNADMTKELLGLSVPATEHSVMCMGSKDSEIETFRRLIEDTYPSGVVSIVSDTWDFWKVITEYTVELKEEILNRTPNEIGLAKTVFRPDSGDPVEILCGVEILTIDLANYKSFEEWKECVAEQMDSLFRENLDSESPHFSENELYQIDGKVYSVTYKPELSRHEKRHYFVDNFGNDVDYCKFEEVELTPDMKGAVECLWDVFGGTTTEKGYKVLNERVGLIYGDSITLERAEAILDRLEKKGFASCNAVFGIGSYTYQYNTRDTFGFAMKATYGIVDGVPREIFKDPITDSGTKKSAKGLLRVEMEEGEYKVHDQQTPEQEKQGCLKTIFYEGMLVEETTLSEIRERLV